MGPFEFKNVINEIQIRQGKWISVLGQISENELPKKTAIPQISENEASKEATEITETVIEEEFSEDRPKLSAISQITVVLVAVFGVLLVMILVLHLRGRASK